MTFTTRAGKGTALTHQELDDNFATLGAVHGADEIVLSVPVTVSEGLLVSTNVFSGVATGQYNYGLSPTQTVEPGFIVKGNFDDTMPDLLTNIGYFGQSLQFRTETASNPLTGQAGADSFLGGFNTYITASTYTDEDNFYARFNISHLDRVNQVDSFPSSAIFDKTGLYAPLGFISSGNNDIGDGTGDINLNGNLFINGLNATAPTATSDPGTAGELRVTTPNGTNFYLYLYADELGWLRTELTTF